MHPSPLLNKEASRYEDFNKGCLDLDDRALSITIQNNNVLFKKECSKIVTIIFTKKELLKISPVLVEFIEYVKEQEIEWNKVQQVGGKSSTEKTISMIKDTWQHWVHPGFLIENHSYEVSSYLNYINAVAKFDVNAKTLFAICERTIVKDVTTVNNTLIPIAEKIVGAMCFTFDEIDTVLPGYSSRLTHAVELGVPESLLASMGMESVFSDKIEKMELPAILDKDATSP